MPPRDAGGDDVHPNGKSTTGGTTPGAGPDQQDDKRTSNNGKGQ